MKRTEFLPMAGFEVWGLGDAVLFRTIPYRIVCRIVCRM